MIERVADAGPVARRGSPAPVTLLIADELEPLAQHVVHDVSAANVATLVVCADGAEALFQIGRLAPDAVVLGAGLRIVGAVDVIQTVRRHTAVPIAVAVGAGQHELAAESLAAGATRTLSRPYRQQELQTLISSWLAPARARWDRESVIGVGALEVDSRAYQARADGRALRLTVREFELLRLLALHSDRVVTRDQIRREVWRASGDVASANTIAVHVRRIRARLSGAADIVSVRGVGYRLTVAERPAS